MIIGLFNKGFLLGSKCVFKLFLLVFNDLEFLCFVLVVIVILDFESLGKFFYLGRFIVLILNLLLLLVVVIGLIWLREEF